MNLPWPLRPVNSPFRTTTVSYDPALLGMPVPYGPGRFPTVSTNALGHAEKAIYDQQTVGAIPKHVAPHATELAAQWAVLTRLKKP